MSLFTKAGNFAHDNLVEVAGSSLTSNLATGATTGAVLDGGIGMMNGDTPTKALAKGAVKGAMFHGAYKGIGNQYTKGVSSTINNSVATLTTNASKTVRSDFNFGNFTKTSNTSLNGIGLTGKADLKTIPFQQYNI